jgi:subtilisin family serine protease
VHSVRQALAQSLQAANDNLPRLRWQPELAEESGAGVRVALLDSGVAWMHPVFDGADLNGRDFTGSGALIDGTGHGTRHAALLVGQDPRRVLGLAPACELLVAKVLDRGGRGHGDAATVDAIMWAVGKKVDVIVMPFGRRPASPRVAYAVRRAVEAGCRLYAAAGNRGPETIAFPARLPGVVAVSAVDAVGHPLSWCCQTQDVDCYAPGDSIRSLGSATLSGSSPATVIAAGVSVLQLARQRRSGALESLLC